MRRIYIILALLMVYSNILYLYGAEERREFKSQPIANEAQKVQQGLQQQKPLVLPQSGPMIPPAIPPNIAAPRIPQDIIRQQQGSPMSLVPPTPIMHNIPSMPKYAAPPNSEIPGVPVFSNTAAGKVIKTGHDKDGILFIEVDDKIFDRELKLKIKNLAETPIIRGASLYKFDDIKTGDTVDVTFYTQNDEEIAVFIKVLTEEEIGEIKQEPLSGLNITQEKTNK